MCTWKTHKVVFNFPLASREGNPLYMDLKWSLFKPLDLKSIHKSSTERASIRFKDIHTKISEQTSWKSPNQTLYSDLSSYHSNASTTQFAERNKQSKKIITTSTTWGKIAIELLKLSRQFSNASANGKNRLVLCTNLCFFDFLGCELHISSAFPNSNTQRRQTLSKCICHFCCQGLHWSHIDNLHNVLKQYYRALLGYNLAHQSELLP